MIRAFIIDDSAADRDTLEFILKKSAALRLFESAEQTLPHLDTLPDILLLDVNLPGITGLELLNMIQAHPVWKNIHVALLICSDHEKAYLEEKGARPSSYLKKPCDQNGFQQLKEQFENIAKNLKN